MRRSFRENAENSAAGARRRLPDILPSHRGYITIHYSPIEQVNRTVGMRGIARIVGHYTNSRASPVQFIQQFHDGFTIRGIEIAGGFSGEHDGGVAGQSAGDCGIRELALRIDELAIARSQRDPLQAAVETI